MDITPSSFLLLNTVVCTVAAAIFGMGLGLLVAHVGATLRALRQAERPRRWW
jgi:uncharacterized membrane protein